MNYRRNPKADREYQVTGINGHYPAFAPGVYLHGFWGKGSCDGKRIFQLTANDGPAIDSLGVGSSWASAFITVTRTR